MSPVDHLADAVLLAAADDPLPLGVVLLWARETAPAQQRDDRELAAEVLDELLTGGWAVAGSTTPSGFARWELEPGEAYRRILRICEESEWSTFTDAHGIVATDEGVVRADSGGVS
ncbi:hypothetical protein [Yinghuangia seranimata]|uniref:hypothetical protein n=1 Tax=Yinghuangia seranimata TaxID=408067 RepID=UPI00248B6012|nr:hypothetical protein [Yinghuangia seranimata]MDI2129550.1 hypothetical protein [Yinghuangia seranimata]